jgi:hypothetical protein
MTCLRVDLDHQEASPRARLGARGCCVPERLPSYRILLERVATRDRNRDFDCGFDPAIQTPEPVRQELPPRDRCRRSARVPSRLDRVRGGRFRADCTPRFSSLAAKSRSRFVRPTSAIEPSTDEYPRRVRLTAASTSLRPFCIDQSSDWPSRMNRAFHDARPASTSPFALRGRCLHHGNTRRRERL